MNAIALASIGMTDLAPPNQGWSPTLVIQGRVYERLGGLVAPDGATPRYNQIYVYDPQVRHQIITCVMLLATCKRSYALYIFVHLNRMGSQLQLMFVWGMLMPPEESLPLPVVYLIIFMRS